MCPVCKTPIDSGRDIATLSTLYRHDFEDRFWLLNIKDSVARDIGEEGVAAKIAEWCEAAHE